MTRSWAHPLRWRRPAGWSASALALTCAAEAAAACGLLIDRQGFVVLCGIAAVLVIGVAWPWLSVQACSASLAFLDARGREGTPTAVRLRCRNHWPIPLWGLEAEGIAAGADPPPPPLHLGPWSTIEREWRFSPERRGRYPTGHLTLACGFPFGLWRARRRVVVERGLIVWPRTVPVGPVPPIAARAHGDGPRDAASVGTGGDLLSVRPYRRGDAVRLVHWANTARHDRLIVREVRATMTRPRVRIDLDADRRAYRDTGGVNGPFEWAVRIAASLLEQWSEQGCELSLRVNGRALRATAHGGMRAALDALATVGGGEGPDNGRDEIDGSPQSGDALVVSITADGSDTPLRRAGGGELRIVLVSEPDWGSVAALPGGDVRQSAWIRIGGPDDVRAKLLMR